MRYLGKIRGKPGLLSCSTIVKTSHWTATLLPITLSLGLGCLLGTYRIQSWSKLRNRLDNWRPLQYLYIIGQKWVCIHVQIFEVHTVVVIHACTTWGHIIKSNKCLIILSGNCTSGRPEQLRSVLSCHSLGFLLSLLCRAMLSCFCLGILLPPFHNYFWNVWVMFP